MTAALERLARVQALFTEYARRLDDNRLDDWLDLFAPVCRYRLLPRENVDQGLPLALMDCADRRMLADRIVSLKEANFFNVHTSRHLIANHLVDEAGDTVCAQADYAVFQTDQEGVSRVFSVGRYEARLQRHGDRFLIHDMRVVADTYGVRTLLAFPI